MKRMLWLLLTLSLLLSACGNHDNIETTENPPASSVQPESPKGSLENPYMVGESIMIHEMYPVSGQPASQIPFRMQLTVTDVYSPEESASARNGRHIPVALLNISVTGEYEGEINLDKFFYRPLLTTEMEKVWPLFFPAEGNGKEVKSLEIGREYELILAVYQEDEAIPAKEYPYLMLSYYYPDSSTLNDIYINLINRSNAQPEETITNLSAEEQAQYYQAAVSAQEKGYYAVSKNLYEAIPNHRDANIRLQSVLTTLSPYDGTYYGESLQHEDVSVWLYIKDGTVWATYDVENTPVLEYELFLDSAQADSTSEITFAPGLTRFFLDNQNAAYTHGFTMTQNGRLWTVSATEGGSDHSWDSTLEKVSDTVDIEFD